MEFRHADRPLESLRELMARLRDPEHGCPWDVQQDFASIAPYTLEEAYEVVDAIHQQDFPALKDELGDLLLQVVFHARIAEEKSLFDLDDVAQGIVDKMVRRHPHVFGTDTLVDTDELRQAWESEKARERARKAGLAEDQVASALEGIAASLPALQRSQKLQQRAAQVGFDWPDVQPVLEKVREELDEVAEAHQRGDAKALADELGDVLMSAVNLARSHGYDAAAVLDQANRKFERRFRAMEQRASIASGDGPSRFAKLSLEAKEALWQDVKRNE